MQNYNRAIKDNISLWMTVYFIDKFNIDLKAASLFVLFITYGGASAASFVYGFSIEKYGYNSMYISWIVICVLSIGILYQLARRKKN